MQRYCADDKRFRQLETAVEYVQKNYARSELSLVEVADYVGLSRVQMSKLFKEHLGIGYLDFLTKLRLHKAQELLANTDLPLGDILPEIGYIDKTGFTRKFKANFGMTPMEYRSYRQGNLAED